MAPRSISNIPIISRILLALLIFMLTISTMPIGTHGLNISLISIASFFPKNLTLEEIHCKLVEISKTRALHFQQHAMIMRSNVSAPISANLIVNLGKDLAPDSIVLQPSVRRTPIGHYMAQVSIGSKPFPTYMVIDTGSDLSWVQCEGCRHCFPLSGTGNFKYTQSQSISHLSCNHPLCTPKLCDQQGFCRYKIEYLGSSTEGIVLTDSFTFPTNSRTTTAKYPGLAFGCGLDNVNVNLGSSNNLVAGIMGLGLGKKSLLVQLQDQTKKRFSYCLPPLDRPTSLRFGDDATIPGPTGSVQGTPLVRGMGRYYVNEVLGVSIDQTRLNINPEVFRLKRDYSGGFAVDSGSPHSLIVQSAYGILKQKMVEYFEVNNRLRPMKKQVGKFELCYDLMLAKNYVLPSVTFHFRGANLVVKPDGVFQTFGRAIKCLAILKIKESGPTVLGAFQQTNHRFLFDGDRYMMSFAPEDCLS